MAVASYANKSKFYNNKSTFNPTYFTHSPTPTHFSPHSHSLGSKDDSRSCLASAAIAGSNTTQGKVEKTPLTSQVKLYLGKVHSSEQHMYRSINQKLCRGLHHPQDHHHRRCTSSRLIPGCLPTKHDATLPLRTRAIPEYHRHAETVRRSTGPPGSLRCLRRVWDPGPYLPTLSANNLVVVASP